MNLGAAWPRHSHLMLAVVLFQGESVDWLCQALRKPGMSQTRLGCTRQRLGQETNEKLLAQDFLLGVALRLSGP